jgi:hypothetical protein
MIDRPMNKFSFKAMTLVLRIRDLFRSPHRILNEMDMIKPGAYILDY